jgi:hypothetical protein
MISMARTLTTGKVSNAGTFYHEANEEEIAAYSQNFLAYIHLLYLLSDQERESGPMADELSQHVGDWKSFAALSDPLSHKRKFFRTQNGSLGLGPACLRENDVIVVLEKANAPCALRPKGDNYLLLGEVYIDEIMHGELAKEIEEGRQARQYFCLD